MSEPERRTLYAIYDHPIDFPDSFVIRQWYVQAGDVEAGPYQAVSSLEEAQALLPEGATELPDHPLDDPKIVGVWA